MTRFIVRRLITTVPIIFGLSVVLFAFIHLLPGNPAAAILGEHATPERIAQMSKYLGLDQPLPVQYVRYLKNALHGDLGTSVINGQPVLEEFMVRFPATLELAVAALIIAVGLGVPLGRLAARHSHAWPDTLITVSSLLGISIPVFVLGLVMQIVLAVDLNVLPASGRLDPRIDLVEKTHFMLIDPWLMANWTFGERASVWLDAIRHLILPALSLSSIPLAFITRITRASVLDVSGEDYVRTARAKGLTRQRVDNRHIMRNAWLPVVTIVGLQTARLLGGAVLVEEVFLWPGVGQWVVQAIQFRDYFVLQCAILIFALIFLGVNLGVDIIYAFLDPQIRYS